AEGGAPHQVQSFGVGGAPVEEAPKGVARVGELSGGEVGRADLAPDFVLRVRVVARDHLAEVLYGFRESRLRARDAPQLVVRVRLFGVNLDGAQEALARRVVL